MPGSEFNSSSISGLLIFLYQFDFFKIRNLIISTTLRLEGGEFFSKTLRTIYKKYHDVQVGAYTHGGCFRAGNFDRKTTIGRYCSIATQSRAFNRNHPLNFKSTHAFFFNPALKVCSNNPIEFTPLDIGNDVWIGHGAIIMPNVKRIENGAVIAAGAVVNKDVPPYSIVVGNPGRVVRYRFSKDIIEELLDSRWWEKSLDELKNEIQSFQLFEGKVCET